MNLRAALARGNRDALVELAQRLADELDSTTSTRDRLPLVRAFLATVAQLESIDAAARRATQLSAVTTPGGATVQLDELLARRHRRAARG